MAYEYSVMLICLILFISSLPAFICECMFGLCHAWPGVVFYLISVGLHFAQFSLFPGGTSSFKRHRGASLQGFQLFQSVDG